MQDFHQDEKTNNHHQSNKGSNQTAKFVADGNNYVEDDPYDNQPYQEHLDLDDHLCSIHREYSNEEVGDNP